MIRAATEDDAESIARIYNYYVEHTVVTFEETPVSAAEMASRMSDDGSGLPRFVYESGGAVCGYAYASKWIGRCAYRHSVECSVYLDHNEVGKGIGGELYQRLLKDLEEKSYHVVIGGIALPNPASVALHEKFGFEKVAHFKQVGWKFGQWIDVGYWQLTFPTN